MSIDVTRSDTDITSRAVSVAIPVATCGALRVRFVRRNEKFATEKRQGRTLYKLNRRAIKPMRAWFMDNKTDWFGVRAGVSGIFQSDTHV
jgi:hypothetical protein